MLLQPMRFLLASQGPAHLDGIGQGMPNVQCTSDIWRWDDNDKWRLVTVEVGLEKATGLPPARQIIVCKQCSTVLSQMSMCLPVEDSELQNCTS